MVVVSLSINSSVLFIIFFFYARYKVSNQSISPMPWWYHTPHEQGGTQQKWSCFWNRHKTSWAATWKKPHQPHWPKGPVFLVPGLSKEWIWHLDEELAQLATLHSDGATGKMSFALLIIDNGQPSSFWALANTKTQPQCGNKIRKK